MARPKHREQVPGTYFVSTQSWERKALFQNDENAVMVEETIFRNRDLGNFKVHAYVLMPDHLDIVLTPAKSVTLEKAVQLIKGGSSHRIGKEHGRRFPVWQQGFTEHMIRDERDFKEHIRYIKDNPVKAHLVTNASEFVHSSISGRFALDEWTMASGAKAPDSAVKVTAGLKPRPSGHFERGAGGSNYANALQGRRVVVTRAAEQAEELVRELEARGAEVLLLPMVAFAPPEDWAPVDEALAGIVDFDAVLFTSANAVRFFLRRCDETGAGREQLASSKHLIGAVGTATARAAMDEGLRVDYVARNHSGEGLARELRDLLAGRKVLLPRSDRADERMPALLREGGANVTEVVAYRTVAPDAVDGAGLARVRGGDLDAIVFASPSAFHNLAECLGADGAAQVRELSKRVQFAAIGATTAGAIRDAGARVAIESRKASAGCLAAAIAKYYERSESATAQSEAPARVRQG
jgi:uroporphyrinogen-III synthase/REP element-mobilizing transposase RayT